MYTQCRGEFMKPTGRVARRPFTFMLAALFILVVLFSAGPCFAAGKTKGASLLAGGSAPEPVRAAHEAYLAGQFGAMVTHVKRALMEYDQDQTIRTNMLRLVDRAIDRSGPAGLPCDWSLPSELRSVEAGVRRTRDAVTGQEQREILVGVVMNCRGVVRNIRLTRYPDRVLIDDSLNDEEARQCMGYTTFGNLTNGEPSDGLYMLHLGLAGGKSVDGWLILTRQESSATPQVQSPTPNEELDNANPELRFANFYSPEYKPGEQRNLVAVVSHTRPAQLSGGLKNESHIAWSIQMENPSIQKLVVGPQPGVYPPGATHLTDGGYRFALVYTESRRFGPMSLTRESRTFLPFSVRHQK